MSSKHLENNPLLIEKTGDFTGPEGCIPYNLLKTEHFMPAIERGIEIARGRLESLRNDTRPVDFENTSLALETLSEELDLVSEIYFNLYSAEANDEFQALAKEISPKLAAFSNDISLDEKVFARVKVLYDKRENANLSAEQKTLLEKQYKGFVRNGALLAPEQKEKLRAIDQELSLLGPKFSENLLKSMNSYVLPLAKEEDLEGLPESLREALAIAAKERNTGTPWALTLDMPLYIPFMKNAKRADLREIAYKAYATRAIGGETDNTDVARQIANLRFDRAQLLGFKTHADYVLAERMAGNPQTVMKFLDRILAKAITKAKEELEELKEFKKQKGESSELKPWDFAYYSERYREEKYSFDEEQLRPYFKLENVVEGCFKLASILFGIKFEEDTSGLPVYHPDVKVYRVSDAQSGTYMGLFYTDFFPRPTKRNGAWMTSLREQGYFKGVIRRPHVSIVCNFTKPTATKPSLLSFDEVKTLFHEFGHALHGLLSQCTYRSLAGTNVYWDFVELPSQFMENWLLEKEVLDLFAKHYQTGESIPQSMVEKIQKIRRYQTGYAALRQLSFCLLDMAWHAQDPHIVKDVFEFEDKVLAPTRLLEKVPGTAATPAFSHIFAGGYSSGYYSYKWAEVLDADAFEYFKEQGLFNPKVAQSYRDNILARGGTDHPMELYKRFRGREPDPDALLRRDGLL
jgi:peptidyl-dipeptidase Dcp